MAEREQQLKVREQLQQAHAQQYGTSLEGAPDGGGGPGIPPLNLPPLPPLGLIDHRTSNTFNLHLKVHTEVVRCVVLRMSVCRGVWRTVQQGCEGVPLGRVGWLTGLGMIPERNSE